MIKLKNLCKTYRSKEILFPALKNIDLSIEKGESVAIMGKSGAGKTTLLNILGCLDSFDSGEYLLNEQPMKGLKDVELAGIRNSSLGFVFQDFALIESKSVLFNAMLPMYFDKTPGRTMRKKALQALNLVGLPDQVNKSVNQLSGGQKQRVAIARAIVNHPDVILADEPTGSLDSGTGAEIMEMLMDMNRSGMTLIVVTHDKDIASYCSRRIVLSDGEMVSDSRSGDKMNNQ